MDFEIRKHKYNKTINFVWIVSAVIGFGFLYNCSKKSADIKQQLRDHKMGTLSDTMELNQNGENPLEGNAEAIVNGAAHYSAMCAVCHGEGGQGNTGPDLLDNSWLHGGDNFSVYNVIMNGIKLEQIKMNPPRGKMPPYKNIFGSHRVLEIMAWLADQRIKLKNNPDY